MACIKPRGQQVAHPTLAYLEKQWFDGKSKVGVTAGASAPEVLVQGVIEQIRAWGIDDVQQGEGEPETIVFVLPKELRK